MVVAVRGLGAVHVSGVSLHPAQLDIEDASTRRHPLARNVLSAENLESRERVVARPQHPVNQVASGVSRI